MLTYGTPVYLLDNGPKYFSNKEEAEKWAQTPEGMALRRLYNLSLRGNEPLYKLVVPVTEITLRFFGARMFCWPKFSHISGELRDNIPFGMLVSVHLRISVGPTGFSWESPMYVGAIPQSTFEEADSLIKEQMAYLLRGI